MPRSLSKALRNYISETDHVYHTVVADIVDAITEVGDPSIEMNTFASKALRLNKLGDVHLQPNIKLALFRYALKYGLLNYSQITNMLSREKDWWVKKSVVAALDTARLGPPAYADLINTSLRSADAEVCSVAVGSIFEHQIFVSNSADLGQHIINRLAAAKIPGFALADESAIDKILKYTLNVENNSFNWSDFLQAEHDVLERLALAMKQSFETDIDAFVVRLDSFCDGVLQKFINLYSIEIGKYNYGSAVNNGPKKLKALIPNAILGFKELHDLRGRSHTSHPYKLKTGKPTDRIKHNEFRRIKKKISYAFFELQQVAAPMVKLSQEKFKLAA